MSVTLLPVGTTPICWFSIVLTDKTEKPAIYPEIKVTGTRAEIKEYINQLVDKTFDAMEADPAYKHLKIE